MNEKIKKNTILLTNKENCCGCTACYSVCPVNAISMTADSEGFLYPEINEKKCISCNKCTFVCAFKEAINKNIAISKATAVIWNNAILFAVKHLNQNVRESSRSGGIFTAVSDYVLTKNGVVYGCVLADNMKVQHIRATNKTERDCMRGSKYVQSDLGDTFYKVKNDLENGLTVLFTGTPCQVGGLHSYLNHRYNNLMCLEIICHGVPSPLILEKYIDWWSKRKLSNVISINFRNKADFGWHQHVETIYFENGTKENCSFYAQLFYSNAVLRPSCYKCPYKNDYFHHSSAEITIGDFWGINKTVPNFDDNKGVSIVLLNNQNGVAIFDAIKENVDFKKATFNEYNLQKALLEPCKKPKIREHLWKELHTKDFSYILKRYTDYGMIYRIKIKLNKFRKL